MKFTVPDNIAKEFIVFLDTLYASFTDQEISQMSDTEQELMRWLDNWLVKKLGENKSKRFNTQEEYFAYIAEKFGKQIEFSGVNADADKETKEEDKI